MENFKFYLSKFYLFAALFCIAACNSNRSTPDIYVDSSVATLAEVAKIMSELPYEEEHLMEVYNAVSSSSGNGYDEEYMMSNLFAFPGIGVGEEWSSTKASSYSRPIRELFTEYLQSNPLSKYSSRIATKAMSSEEAADDYIRTLSASDIQIYWPYSEDWDGTTLPIITYDPGYGLESNMGYILEYGDFGAMVVDSVLVTEELAMTRPVWVINLNNDSGYTPLDMFIENQSLTASPLLSIIGDNGQAEESRMLLIKSIQALRNYDSWFAGASEFFIKCGAVDSFNASTDEELRLYNPSVTDFVIVVKRRQIEKTIPLDVILLTEYTSLMDKIAFLIIEDDGGETTSWDCTAVVKYNSKSYGFELSIPYRTRDDIVWRGQLAYSFFEGQDEVTGRFGDVIVTFSLI